MDIGELARKAGVKVRTAQKHLNRLGIKPVGYTEEHLERVQESVSKSKPGRPRKEEGRQ